ncbi:hypothetical protein [Rhizosaccharibacter radicis]|uniref:Uncharacterized protein n=1 Tax=Rhizosaccharibacter radicis TaxID=2782605 RepID=A0ABT1VXC2_9PROT|nr:hypothetical protein [Acetobacteraceae bacterium KSS12]
MPENNAPFIRVQLGGNPGNVMFMYMAALSLQRATGATSIANVNIPLFDISLPDRSQIGLNGLHFTVRDEPRNAGRIAIEAAARLCRTHPPDFIQIEGFCQHTENLLPRDAIDYDAIFRRPDVPRVGGREDELVISIRGGEILREIQHPHYTQIPAGFYEDIIRSTKLRPIFFGQLSDNPYCNGLRRRFPGAVFKQGTSPSEDFDYLRQSKNIIPSVSSFAWLAAWLSNAERIFLPLTGLMHPNQHKNSFYVPLGDRRYSYFVFPINYWLPIDHFPESERAMEGRWFHATETQVRNMFLRPPLVAKRADHYAAHLDPEFYVRANPDEAGPRQRHGDCSVYNHFLSRGFYEGRDPFMIDKGWYCRTYPEAAAAIGRNDYLDEVHHYVEAGSKLGYRLHPSL